MKAGHKPRYRVHAWTTLAPHHVHQHTQLVEAFGCTIGDVRIQLVDGALSIEQGQRQRFTLHVDPFEESTP